MEAIEVVSRGSMDMTELNGQYHRIKAGSQTMAVGVVSCCDIDKAPGLDQHTSDRSLGFPDNHK